MASESSIPDSGVPKTIWFTWFQGLEAAPELVRRCHDSWQARNPGWSLVVLDDRSVGDVASLDYTRGHLGGQLQNHRANVLRLELLSRYGGVWADATTLCARPLDDWLPAQLASGFFAFRRPGPDRLLSSWFLAAEPDNHLVVAWFRMMSEYWCEHSFRHMPRLRLLLTRLLEHSSRGRSLWFSPPFRDALRVAPYFAVHYGFEKVVREDVEAARIWNATPDMSANPPHGPVRQGLFQPVSAAVRADIDRGETPVYKLNWRLGERPIPPGSALGYLLAASGGV
jgi:capsular polysaccharide synthesis protein